MCGIGGIVGGPPPREDALNAMADAMAHRGPDAMGTWRDERCGLAFRRLAILDLDERANQPMSLGPLRLAFNGEIYNFVELRSELERLGHRFTGTGDTEVLLHAWAQWGEVALDRLDGMFALAVWDEDRATLSLAVDPFGEKPLHLRRDGARVVFASDVRALRAATREPLDRPDADSVAAFLALGITPRAPGTFHADVERLPAAHVATWRHGRMASRRYWSPRSVAVPATYGEAVAAVRAALETSVRRRLRADVPVGTSLSGGVDSSAVAGLVARLAPSADRHAFTAAFQGFAKDEWAHATAVASAAGVATHHAIRPTARDVARDLPVLVRDQEEPFGALSIYAQWRVMACAKEAGVTVLLDGQGADELFGGYDATAGFALRSMAPRALARALRDRPDRAALALRTLGADRAPEPLARRLRARFASPYLSAAAAEAGVRAAGPVLAPAEGHAGGPPLRRELLRQSLATSLPALLRYADRSSMAHSREVRLPFLSRDLADLAFSLPAGHLLRGQETKAVLRDAVADLVPQAVLRRRDKVGFEPPQAAWLRDPALLDVAREALLDPSAAALGLHRAALEQDLRTGELREHASMWRALSVALWRQELASPSSASRSAG